VTQEQETPKILCCMLPAIATFIILQRFIVRALTSGAIKG
jgi:ABC-type maltose transport system permease subunit